MDLSSALQDSWDRVVGWVEGAVSALPSVVAALLVLLAFWIAARIGSRSVRRLLDRVSDYQAVNGLLSKLAFVGVLSLGLLVALGILDLDKTVTSLLAGVGILGLAVGFAAQDSVSNLIAGVFLSVRRPLSVGELVETNGIFGTVEEITLRTTTLRTGSGQIVHVPNNDVVDSPLTNYSDSGQRRVDVTCGVSYAADLARARDVAIDAVSSIEGLSEDRAVELFYDEFGGSSVNFTLRFWIPFAASHADFLRARSEAMVRLKQAFDEEGIGIPFPITTLDFGIGRAGVDLAEQLRARSA